MIKEKKEIREYILADLDLYKLPNLFSLWLKGDERYPIVAFIVAFRHYEYYYNNSGSNVLFKIKKYYWKFLYTRRMIKFNLYIGVNSAGQGLRLIHPGFRKFGTVTSIGNRCIILPNVLIGKKNSNTTCRAVIGDDCYIGTGATILAPVVIGNNVTIGAGSVVIRDIPDNAVVGGVPAKILKYKE